MTTTIGVAGAKRHGARRHLAGAMGTAGLCLALAGLSACQGTDVPGDQMANAATRVANDAAAGDTATGNVTADSNIPLRITMAKGGQVSFSVEVALDEATQERGLEGRTRLAAGAGMLFPFPYPKDASFWMKNVEIPLDLLFVLPDGTIAAILHGKPNDLHPLAAGQPVSAVVEIAGGRAKALGLAPGDVVQWGQCPDHANRPDVAADSLNFCPPVKGS